jgi:hypothetical protein
MQTKDILALESVSEGCIVLHKEGIFWRAYQNSAFLFYTHIRALGRLTAGVELNPSPSPGLCPSFSVGNLPESGKLSDRKEPYSIYLWKRLPFPKLQ